jgi:hypothetical protein
MRRTSTRRVRDDPTPLEFAGFQHPQQLDLLPRRHVGDLVEEQRAAVGQLEAAHAVRLGVGERALHMAEQLALEHPLGQAAGVHGYHRARRAHRRRMQRHRDDALARAVLARDEHVRVGRPQPRDHLEDRLHRGRVGNQVRPRLVAQHPVLGLQALPAAQRAPEIDLRPDDAEEPLVLPRLLHEIARAAPHRLDRQVDAPPGGHHDRRQRLVDRLQPREQVEPLAARRRVARVVQIHEDGVELALLDGAQDGGRRGGGLDFVAFGLEQQAQGFQHVRLVVSDEHADGRVRCHAGVIPRRSTRPGA